MPCGHRYLHCESFIESLAVDEFHDQWRHDKELPFDDVVDLHFTYKDPIKVRSKQAGKATTRQLSLFEHVRRQNPLPTTTQRENFTHAPPGVTIIPYNPRPVVISSNLQPLLNGGGHSVDACSASEAMLVSQAQTQAAQVSGAEVIPMAQNNSITDHVSLPQPPTTERPQDNQTPQEESNNDPKPSSQISLGQMQGWLAEGTQWLDDTWSMFPPLSQSQAAPASPRSQSAPPQPQPSITPQRTIRRDSDQALQSSPTRVLLTEPFPTFIRPDAVEEEVDLEMEEEQLVWPPQPGPQTPSPRRSKRTQRPPRRPETEMYY